MSGPKSVAVDNTAVGEALPGMHFDDDVLRGNHDPVIGGYWNYLTVASVLIPSCCCELRDVAVAQLTGSSLEPALTTVRTRYVAVARLGLRSHPIDHLTTQNNSDSFIY